MEEKTKQPTQTIKTKTKLEKWLDNYNNADILTNALELKIGNYGGKYLPWAIALNYFMAQGGTVESKNLHFERVFIKGSTADGDSYYYTYFVRIVLKWMGENFEYIYPILENSGKATLQPTQASINKAYQRGITKAIAIFTGIGYRLYEGETDWDDTSDNKEIIKSTPQDFKVAVLGLQKENNNNKGE